MGLLRNVMRAWAEKPARKARSSEKQDTYVLCVGMQTSRKFGGCPGARLDSNEMAKLLGNYGKVVLLQDKAANNMSVTRCIDEGVRHPLFILYYSGHGGQMRDRQGEGGKSEFLCLDNGPLHDYTIWDHICEAKGRVVMIFDCCHSATMFRSLPSKKVENVGFQFSMIRSIARSSESSDNDILVWSGCPADDFSYGDDSGGVFTNGIRNGFSDDDTYEQVWNRASKAAKDQRPVKTVIGAGFGGKAFR